MQESSRAGQDRSPYTARLMLAASIPNTYFSKANMRTKTIVTNFIQEGKHNKVCWQQILDKYFNNNSRRKLCKPLKAACNICYLRLCLPNVLTFPMPSYVGT
jgi:hypothetical protein